MIESRNTKLRHFLDLCGMRTRMTGIGLVAQSEDLCWIYDDHDYAWIDDLTEERVYQIAEARERREQWRPLIDIRDARHYRAMLVIRRARQRYVDRIKAVQFQIARANRGCQEGGHSILVNQRAHR